MPMPGLRCPYGKEFQTDPLPLCAAITCRAFRGCCWFFYWCATTSYRTFTGCSWYFC